jgi:cytochrome P450
MTDLDGVLVMDSQPQPRPYPFGAAEGLHVHSAYREIREQPGLPLVQPPYGSTTWLATRYADVRMVLGDSRFSRAHAVGEDEPRVHPFVPDSNQLSSTDPPEHTRLRRALMGAFTTRRMDQLRPRVQQMADELLDTMEKEGPPADLMRALAIPLPVSVVCELLGVPYEERDRFRACADMMLSTAEAHHSPQDARQAFLDLCGYLADLLTARQNRPEPADDLLSVLVQAKEVEKLSEAEMLGLASAVLIAGQETAVNQIGSFMYLLLTHQDQLELLRCTPDLLPQAIEELLRMAPVTATAGFARRATEDVDLNGFLVRQGETVMPTLFAANDDPAIFPQPQRLDLTRVNANQHLSFSYGPHHCPGSQLARMELQVAIGTLVRRLPTLRLGVSPDQVPWKAKSLARGPRSLPVEW